jgi:hypothetical protein
VLSDWFQQAFLKFVSGFYIFRAKPFVLQIQKFEDDNLTMTSDQDISQTPSIHDETSQGKNSLDG